MDLGLTGKVALITGASQGIGKAAALKLAQEGARVGICARREDLLEQAAQEIRERSGSEVLAVPADVANASDVQRLVHRVAEELGRIDVLFNNAGGSRGAPFEETTDAAWSEDLNLKVLGLVRLSREVIPYMRRVGGGRIINLANQGAKAPGPGSAPNTVSRAACIAATKAMSRELGRDNILVNIICVGSAKSTHWERRWQARRAREPGLTLERFYEEMGQRLPLGRVGETEEVANVVAFLASSMATYITGAAINVDGGASPVT